MKCDRLKLAAYLCDLLLQVHWNYLPYCEMNACLR